MAVSTPDAPTLAPTMSPAGHKTGMVISKDGTPISYRQLGRGPGIVILHGAMESAASHMELAQALSNTFTLYLPDRRGRGASGPYGKDYSVQKEVEDLDALLKATGAHNVFGVSSGAIISLAASLQLPAIHKAALFEPPISVNNSLTTDFTERVDREMAQGDTYGGMVTGMLGAQMGPPIFQKVPRWLLVRLTKAMARAEKKSAKPGDITMEMLASTMHYDFVIAKAYANRLEAFKGITTNLLLMNGSKSPAYLQLSVKTLAKMFSNARYVEFAGLGHGATGNKNRQGKPEIVAQVLRQFFG